MPTDHEHPVNRERVAAARAGVLSLDDAGRLGMLLGMLADPVRSRILFALAAGEELCVGDLALALDVTEDQISYAHYRSPSWAAMVSRSRRQCSSS